jgi:D-3-phosphoglycerate dehydrogenase/C-terminal binding protein
VRRLAGTTFGVVGLGRIGSATALRAKALRMRVIACDPYLRPGFEKSLGVERVSLETLLRESDVVSLHTPLTEETRHLIDRRALRRMKPHSLLINTARGAVVDVEALAVALERGWIGGAGIDVLPVEPVPADSKLIRLWQRDDPPVNLVMTPHTAFYSESGSLEMRVKAAQEVARVLRGEPPLNCVNSAFLRRRR